jgi:hypothetical protein
MSVIVTFVGGLGNNLFQYSLGRIIAEKLKLALICERETQSDRRSLRQVLNFAKPTPLEEVSSLFPKAPLLIPGTHIRRQTDRYQAADDSGRSQMIDLEHIFSDRTPRKIRLRGLYQRYEYYAEYREKLSEWFRPPALDFPYAIQPRDVLVDLQRGADYGAIGWTLPLTYIERALDSMSSRGKIFICGSDIDSCITGRLARYNPVYWEGDDIVRFSLAFLFRRIVLSNCPVAWWAGWLSSADEIIAPRSSNSRVYAFSGYGDVDLHMREDRYREIDVEQAAPMALFERKPNVNVLRTPHGAYLLNVHAGRPEIRKLHRTPERVIDWLLGQYKSIRLDAIIRRCGNWNASDCVSELVESGILAVNPMYLE